MLVLNPTNVKFGQASWTDALAITIDRGGDALAIERGDLGPHIVFADVPEQRVMIRVQRGLTRDDLAGPRPSEQAELHFCTAPGASDASRRRVRATCVVTAVSHELGRARAGGAGRPGEALQTITLVALSADGVADPVAIEDASDGAA